MGEFDLSLVREFRSRPAFYDRNDNLFRDKFYIAREWQQISNQLGYDVSLLKDRMLQLRNRFNLEKRRLENLREEHPGRIIESPWPLFAELGFLNDHIRSRRSYKRLMAGQDNGSMNSSVANEFVYSGSNVSSSTTTLMGSTLPNNLVSVKMEEEEEEERVSEETESGDGSQEDHLDNANYTNNFQRNIKQNNSHSSSLYQQIQNSTPIMTMPQQFVNSIEVRNLDSMRAIPSTRKETDPPEHQNSSVNNLSDSSSDIGVTTPPPPPPLKRARLASSRGQSSRESVCHAFGHYIYSSLMELPKEKALKVMESMQYDLFKVMKQNANNSSVQIGHFNGH
ncbi:transcription factor Adf-1 [Teleopsis dalmanni]|uniref:transcription factor Adf-1 n=1 Tax=Teleopsis dalmanni TaxID=139649 RepID=UPI0018CCC68A|nr:transcription factor Adf-1 [Teleopsis dalmanni]